VWVANANLTMIAAVYRDGRTLCNSLWLSSMCTV